MRFWVYFESRSTCFLEGLDKDCERKGDNAKVSGLKNCKNRVLLTEMGNAKMEQFGPSMTHPHYKSRGWQHTPKDHLLNYIISLIVLPDVAISPSSFSPSCP